MKCEVELFFIDVKSILLTYTTLSQGITEVASLAFLTVEALRIVDTLQAFTCLRVTVAGGVKIYVVITVTRLTCSVHLRRHAEVVVSTSTTVRT